VPSTPLAARHAVGAVRSQAAFGQMRSYVLNMYRGVQVRYSYTDNGSYFDCVVTMTQPTARDLHITRFATPPQLRGRAAHAGQAVRPVIGLGRTDAYGNAISCPSGTVPMQRLSLDRMMRFPTLAAFQAKEPPGATVINPDNTHRYARGEQWVGNYGGNSWLNVWNPSGEYSVSQQWFASQTSAPLQTVEGGSVHYPAKFGGLAVLFIFFTNNNYAKGSGCYNLECDGFVQTSNAFSLGGSWANYSSPGGTQWGFGEQ
jgi:hypothetical protein